jgi:5-methylcytosine-specific restriction endonuclease McrA
MKDLHNPYEVARRKPLTAKQKLKMFLAHQGVCCICGGKIDATRERWIDEHIDPLWRGGSNDLSNRAPAHEKCARRKTAKEATDKAKGERIAEKAMGARTAKTRPMPCGRGSPWKKKMSGEVVPRVR